MKIQRRFTKSGISPYAQFEYTRRSSVLRNPDGSLVFNMENIDVPSHWSQVATDILAQKYFRKAGIPLTDEQGKPILDDKGNQKFGSETNLRQVVHRLAGCWREWGEKHNYFDTSEDAEAFYDEIAYTLLKQMTAPNSPQWFNTGLNYAYGITGKAQGHYYVDPISGKLAKSEDAYTHPQPHACARRNTYLFTNEGVLTIGSIVDESKVGLQIFDGNKYVNVLAVKNNGVRSIYRATLKNGNFIEFTDDHRIWSSVKRLKDGGEYSWSELRTLLGCKVQQIALQKRTQLTMEAHLSGFANESSSSSVSTNNFSDFNEMLYIDSKNESSQLDIANAALAGWIIGDGYYGKYNKNAKTTMFGAITINDDEFNYVTDLFTEIFGDYTVGVRRDIGELYRTVKLDSKRVDGYVEEYELNSNSLTAVVPECIFKSSSNEQFAFLRSLFQADGCVRLRIENGRNSGDVTLTTISEELAHGVQVLLLNLGIYSTVTRCNDSREDRHKPFQVSIAYYSERKKFEDHINFISEDKRNKLQVLNETVIGKNKYSTSEETIISIEYIGDEEVFDIQTETAQFAANGVIVHNCFIQSVEDDLVNEGGIFDLVTREARIFKFGSGTGSNFSNLRGSGERLSGGGASSGLMSFLKIFDRAAGAIKSGGTTRRAAKMVIVNIDHPDIETFIEWKAKEEEKVAALVAGSKINATFLQAILDEAIAGGANRKTNDKLNTLVVHAVHRGVPMNYIERTLTLLEQGFTTLNFDTYDTHYESEAYITVSGQNSNNSVRVTNEFMQAVINDGNWELKWRSKPGVAKTLKARDLWAKINMSAWKSADPGLQFDTTINEWHTCPADGRINGSNPCVTANTLVPTHQGLERIGDLIGQSRGVKSIDGKMHWVENIFPTGRKPVYELKTKAGYRLELTADHKVFTENRGDVPAHQLTKDDVLRLVAGTFGVESTGSVDIAQLIGLLLGDGCITHLNEQDIAGNQREVGFLTMSKEEHEVVEWATNLINSLRPEFGEHTKNSATTETATTLRTAVGSPKILSMFKKYAVLNQGSTQKLITSASFQLTKEEQSALLRGLFTADGTVANYGDKSQYVALDSTSLELLQQVQLLLLNFGIKAKVYANRRAGKLTSILPDGNGGTKEYAVEEMHSLRISRFSRIVFE
ncbi:MAG: hypothetical protein IPM69_10965 [Ignavibacteria bacterium]|nr:hypothetical protein [Ignavibacteria bacterium]